MQLHAVPVLKKFAHAAAQRPRSKICAAKEMIIFTSNTEHLTLVIVNLIVDSYTPMQTALV